MPDKKAKKAIRISVHQCIPARQPRTLAFVCSSKARVNKRQESKHSTPMSIPRSSQLHHPKAASTFTLLSARGRGKIVSCPVSHIPRAVRCTSKTETVRRLCSWMPLGRRHAETLH